jgi:tetratricopeptide (TPR) repeat protein
VAQIFAGLNDMTDLLTLSVFNPQALSDSDFVTGFVARQRTLDGFVADLKAQANGLPPRHHIIFAQRGFGKTTLLRRLAIAIRETPELAAHWIALSFREEQYNVIDLHLFWQNCVEALLAEIEKSPDASSRQCAAKLEAELLRIEAGYAKDRQKLADGAVMLTVFHEACERLQRRPVLLVDNLNLILEALPENLGWTLRDTLQQANGPVMIAAASISSKRLTDKSAAFFDFYRVTQLSRLELTEMRECLLRIAAMRGVAGKAVQRLVDEDEGRIATLNDLTGGNPRTLAVIYMLLESQASADAFADLEKLLDGLTPLYKARTEEPPVQTRAVLDAVALAWDPVTAKEIADRSGLAVGAVNSHLKRLENTGFVEQVARAGTARNGYQIVERLFNIWYLMRHGSLRARQRVRWLIRMMEMFYTPTQRASIGRELIEGAGNGHRYEYLLAVHDSLHDVTLRRAIEQTVNQVLAATNGTSKNVDKNSARDLSEIAPHHHRMRELKRTALLSTPIGGWPTGVTAEQFWTHIGGSLAITFDEKKRVFDAVSSLNHLQIFELMKVIVDERSRLARAAECSIAQIEKLATLICNGDLETLDDVDGARAVFTRTGDVTVLAVVSFFRGEICFADGDHAGAEAAYTEATKAHATFAAPWRGLGYLLMNHMKRFDEAEAAFRAAIKLDATSESSWSGLGWLLMEHLTRFDEAETALKEAIKIDATYAESWRGLGYLLMNHLKRFDEAEVSFREAIKIDAKSEPSWRGLAWLLMNHLRRFDEAETAFREAIKIDAKSEQSWRGLGWLLMNHLRRFDEADTAFKEALVQDPKSAFAWFGLGNLLTCYLWRFDEAEVAYREVIKINAHGASAWNGLGNLLLEHLRRPLEAQACYETAAEIDRIQKQSESFATANLAYLHFIYTRKDALARNWKAQCHLVAVGSDLLTACQAVAEGDVHSAWAAMDAAVKSDDPDLWISYRDDLFRVGAFASEQGMGETFLERMESQGYADRYAAMYHGFQALVQGEDKLLDVNPEVRRIAEPIYRGFAAIRDNIRWYRANSTVVAAPTPKSKRSR